jgi:hypothetical protein
VSSSSSPLEAALKVGKIAHDLPQYALRAGYKAGKAGTDIIKTEAVSMFGPDRKPSNWKKGRKTVNGKADVKRQGDTIVGKIYPVGDPFYVFVKGRRGGKVVRPGKGKRALKSGDNYYSQGLTGSMPAKPHHWTGPEAKMAREVPEVFAKAQTELITQALKG